MPETTIAELLERNVQHTASLSEGHFDAVEDSQTPAVVTVCCSDSRVSQEGMWAVDEPGWLFSVGNIGNQIRERHGDTDVVNGDLLYPIRFTETNLAVVVGHTGCGAVTAALERVMADTPTELSPGIEARIETLVPIIERGLESDAIDPDRDVALVDQLVEYNVDEQITFLRENAPFDESVTLAGFVYDFQGVYGDTPGRSILVNLDGETGVETLREHVPAQYESHVRRLTEL